MLNRVVLQGRLAADPELRQTPNGVSVATFRIGVQRNYNRELTDWINVVVWRQTAEFVKRYFTKGNMILVEGSIQSRTYQDRDGNNRNAVEVVADQVYFGESKGSSSTQRSQNNGYSGNQASSNAFPVPEFEEPKQGQSFSVGNISDYEEIDADDGDLPF